MTYVLFEICTQDEMFEKGRQKVTASYTNESNYIFVIFSLLFLSAILSQYGSFIKFTFLCIVGMFLFRYFLKERNKNIDESVKKFTADIKKYISKQQPPTSN